MGKTRICKQCSKPFLPKKSNKIYCAICAEERKRSQDKKSKRLKRAVKKETEEIKNIRKKISQNVEDSNFSEKFNRLLTKPEMLWTEKERSIVMRGLESRALFKDPQSINAKSQEILKKIFGDEEEMKNFLKTIRSSS